MGISITTEEISVVFFFSPTESRDAAEGLIRITVLPPCSDVSVRLQVRCPIGKPMELQLPLAHGGTDTEGVAPKGFEGIRGEIEVTPTHRVLA